MASGGKREVEINNLARELTGMLLNQPADEGQSPDQFHFEQKTIGQQLFSVPRVTGNFTFPVEAIQLAKNTVRCSNYSVFTLHF